jgi:hypothetical protein
MPFDVSAGSFAAVAITAVFWWTVLSLVRLTTRPKLAARYAAAALAHGISGGMLASGALVGALIFA